MERSSMIKWAAVVVAIVAYMGFRANEESKYLNPAPTPAPGAAQPPGKPGAGFLPASSKPQGKPLLDGKPIPKSVTQLIIRDTKVGTGPAAKSGDAIVMNYRGTLTDGTEFDTSYGRGPFNVTLGEGKVIKGWDQGLVGMKPGGKRLLVIPPDLGYGADGQGATIPPNATLVFEVEMMPK